MGMLKRNNLKTISLVSVVLTLVVLLFFYNSSKYETAEVAWIEKNHKLLTSRAQILSAGDASIDGKIIVLPTYNCNFHVHSVLNKVAVLFRLDCFLTLMTQKPQFKALILVDSSSQTGDRIRRDVAREKSWRKNIFLLNFEKSVALLDTYE